MERMILRSERIPIWFELGFFNLFGLAILLPLFWVQLLTKICWGFCCCGHSLELFYQGNLIRIMILGAGFLALPLLELLGVFLALESGFRPGLSTGLRYYAGIIWRSLPVLLLVLAVMALPIAKLGYAGLGLLGLFLALGKQGVLPSPLCDQSGRAPYYHLKGVLIYLGCLLLIPVLFFSSAMACDCGKISSVKANMHTLQTMVETYAIYSNGVYPSSLTQLKQDAKRPGLEYWKDFNNPYSRLSGEGLSYALMPADLKPLMPKAPDPDGLYRPYWNILWIRFYPVYSFELPEGSGLVLYERVNATQYFIYGLDHRGQIITDKSWLFFLSNS